MNKDVIYIDVEDDITAIIGKVKTAKEKIVALVPPKRVGVLQSAVNLRLLGRAAEHSNKRLVLITNNQALSSLAAAATIPVARNLQSKPEIAEIPVLAIDDDDDVIDGAQLPIGEHAKTAEAPLSKREASADKAVSDIEKEASPSVYAAPPVAGQALAKPKAKKGPKVPNFNTFRKKLFLIVGGSLLLVGFLVWAIFFAPRATVVITAQTVSSTVSQSITLTPDGTTEPADNILNAQIQTQEDELTVEFTPTGEKEVGEEASGQIVFQNCESPTSQTVPAGTAVSSNGRNYLTQSAITVPGGTGGFGGCVRPGVSDPVAIVAEDIGSEYNTSSGTSFSVAGHANSSREYFRAQAQSDIDGGSSRQVTVVSQQDIELAKAKLAEQENDEAKAQLSARFNDESVVLPESFIVEKGEVSSSPAVDQEAEGKATLTQQVTYSLWAIPRADLNTYLDFAMKQEISDRDNQRVYANGSDDVTFAEFRVNDDTATTVITANGQVGPDIQEEAIKEQVKGKEFGEVQSEIEAIDGVQNVDVTFWPFWVNSVPNSIEKIMVEFKLNES